MISRQAKKIFLRNIPIVVLSAVFFAVLIGLTVKSFSEAFDMGVFPFKKIWVFHQTQTFSEYVFIFFLIVSYEYFAMTEKPSIKEALRTTPVGFDCLKRRQLLVMTVLALLFFVVCVIFNTVAAGLFGCLTAKFLPYRREHVFGLLFDRHSCDIGRRIYCRNEEKSNTVYCFARSHFFDKSYLYEHVPDGFAYDGYREHLSLYKSV